MYHHDPLPFVFAGGSLLTFHSINGIDFWDTDKQHQRFLTATYPRSAFVRPLTGVLEAFVNRWRAKP